MSTGFRAAVVAALVAVGMPAVAAAGIAPVPASKLVSRTDLQFNLEKVRQETGETTLLMYRPAAGAEPFAVARIASSTSADGNRVSIHRLALPEKSASAELEVAILERLYVLAMRQEADSLFCLSSAPRSCDASKDGYSHSRLLRELVQARQRVLGRKGAGGTAGAAWRVVSLAPHRNSGDTVGVRVMNDRSPMQGATVIFNKAPHFGCVAKSGADGFATCDLVDQHPEEHAHADEREEAVVALFPGDVGTDRVLVPTTLVLPK